MKTQFLTKWNPSRPFASSNLSKGVYRHNRDSAIQKTFIQSSSPLRNTIIIDIDKPDGDYIVKELSYDKEIAPIPNFYTLNPQSGHVHAGYFIEGFTLKGTKADRTRMLLSNSLRKIYGGDPNYNGFLMRNPLVHPSEWLTDKVYNFDSLMEFLPKKHKRYVKNTIVDDDTVLGRNCYVFENTRKIAYSLYRQLDYSDNLLYESLMIEAENFNREYSCEQGLNRLSTSEINSIVKSIYGFVVSNFSRESFSKIQSNRSLKRWSGHDDKFEDILKLKNSGLSFKAISNTLGINVNTVKTTYYRNSRKS